MQAVILAGGKGSRLLPRTSEIPKPMVKIGHHPIIEILIKRLVKSGVTKVTIAVSHMAEQIKNYIGDGSKFGIEIKYSTETKPLSTIGPLKLISDLPEHFLVVNGDILTDIDFAELYKFHQKEKALLTVATYQRHDRVDYGVIVSGDEGQIIGFVEKPEVNFQVSTGIYMFSKKVLAYVPDNEPFGFDQLMKILLEKEERVLTYPFNGYWLDIGRPDDYQKANEDIEKIKSLIE